MDLNYIKLNWRVNDNKKEANINMWDSKADYFGNYEIQNFKDDEFLKLLKEEELLKREFNVLDVGCGGGKYTLSISKECNYIKGIDLSEKMIRYAINNKQKYNIKNTDFEVGDWQELDVISSKYYKNYDLVYASLTPAVQSYDTLNKINEASRKFCLIRCNTKRSDSVYDEIKKILNIKSSHERINKNFMYIFNTLWLEGYLPRVHYEYKIWLSKEKLNNAFDIYINMLNTIRNIDANEEIKVKEYLKKISINGYIEEEIKSTISTIFWDVNKRK